jgi:hypothetical protein
MEIFLAGRKRAPARPSRLCFFGSQLLVGLASLVWVFISQIKTKAQGS